MRIKKPEQNSGLIFQSRKRLLYLETGFGILPRQRNFIIINTDSKCFNKIIRLLCGNCYTKRILALLVIVCTPLLMLLVENDRPFFLTGDGKQRILSSRKLFAFNLHSFVKFNCRSLIRTSPPYLTERFVAANHFTTTA